MFKRNTFTPAKISSRNCSGDRQAGPTVATIFVRELAIRDVAFDDSGLSGWFGLACMENILDI
jgi:hypothetical protein